MTLHFPQHLPREVTDLVDRGQFERAREVLAERSAGESDLEVKRALLCEAERLRRIALEFSLTPDDLIAGLAERDLTTDAEEIERWRGEGLLQSLVIEGERRFFAKEARNLLRRSPEAAARATHEPERPDTTRDHFAEILAHPETEDGLCCPKRFRVTHSVTLRAGTVPWGETVRCWLPLPREERHQHDIEILRTDPEPAHVAPGNILQRTVFFERQSTGEPMTFSVTHEFTTWASERTLDPALAREPDPDHPHLQPREPHLALSPEVRDLAGEITRGIENPLERVRAIYRWIADHVVWIGERDYSTIPDIPALCLEREAGDCGVQALTFIALCRAVGVPARWESGWWLAPGQVNMHDWARFHLEPWGWLWADLTRAKESRLSDILPDDFHCGNIDAYRMVTSADFGQPFDPPKAHPRSDTVDLQRGELEWDGGNLHFDAWDWEFDVEEIPVPQSVTG